MCLIISTCTQWQENKTETDRYVPGRAMMFKVIVAQLSVTNIG